MVALGRQKQGTRLAVILEEDFVDGIPSVTGVPERPETSKGRTSIERQIDGSTKKPYGEGVVIKCDENSELLYENIGEVIKRSHAAHGYRGDTPYLSHRDEKYKNSDSNHKESESDDDQRDHNNTAPETDLSGGKEIDERSGNSDSGDIQARELIQLNEKYEKGDLNGECEHLKEEKACRTNSGNTVNTRATLNDSTHTKFEHRGNSDSNISNSKIKSENSDPAIKQTDGINKASSEVRKEKHSEATKESSSRISTSDHSGGGSKKSGTAHRRENGSRCQDSERSTCNTDIVATGNSDPLDYTTESRDTQQGVGSMKKLRGSSSSKNKQKGEPKPKNGGESCRSSKERRAARSSGGAARSVSCETLIMDMSPHDWDDWGTIESKKAPSAVSRRRILERRTLAAGDADQIDAKPKFASYYDEDIYSAGPINNGEKFMNYKDDEVYSFHLKDPAVKHTNYHDEEIYSSGLMAPEVTKNENREISSNNFFREEQTRPRRREKALEEINPGENENKSKNYNKQNSGKQTKSYSKTSLKPNNGEKHTSIKNMEENFERNEKLRRPESPGGQQLESSNFREQIGDLSSPNQSLQGKSKRREASDEAATQPACGEVAEECEGTPVTVVGRTSNEGSLYAQEGAPDGSPCTRRLRSVKLSDAGTKSLLVDTDVGDAIRSNASESDASGEMHESPTASQYKSEQACVDDHEEDGEMESKTDKSTLENYQNKSSMPQDREEHAEGGTDVEQNENANDNPITEEEKNTCDYERDEDNNSEPLYDMIDNVLHRTIDETFDGIDPQDNDSDKATSDLGDDDELYQTPSELIKKQLDHIGEDSMNFTKRDEYATRLNDSQEILQNDDLVIIEKQDKGLNNGQREERQLLRNGEHDQINAKIHETEAQTTENDGKTPQKQDQVRRGTAKIIDTEAQIAGNEEEITGNEAQLEEENLQNRARDTVGRVRSIFEHSALHNEPEASDRRFHSIRAPMTSRHIEICKSDASSQTFPRRPLNNKNSGMKLRLNSAQQQPKTLPTEDREVPTPKTPCHVLRITAEIAEYQRRSEDIKRMASLASGCFKATKPELKATNHGDQNEKANFNDTKTRSQGTRTLGINSEAAKEDLENSRTDTKSKLAATTEPKLIEKSSIDDTKNDIITELSATLQGRQSRAIESGDEESSRTSFLEHSKILDKLKQSKQGGHEPSRKSQARESVTTSTGKTVHLRKPVLAKGFNVQKALQDRPRDFHVREHRALSKYYSSDTRIRSKSASAIPADGGGGDGESVSSETSDDSGVSNDSSMSSKSSQAFKKPPKKLSRVADERSLPTSNSYLGDTVDFARKANVEADDYDDTSIKWIDPEILAKIRSVGTTVIFFGKRTPPKNATPENTARHNKEAPRLPRRLEGTGDRADLEKCRRYDAKCAGDSTETDIKPGKSCSGPGSHEISLNHYKAGNDSGASQDLIEARDAAANIKLVGKRDDGNFTHRSFQSGSRTSEEEPIYGNLPNKRRGESANKFDSRSSISGGEDVRKQLELVLKTELRKCTVGDEHQNQPPHGNLYEGFQDFNNAGSQKRDRFTEDNYTGRSRDYHGSEGYGGSFSTSDDWRTRPCEGRSVTRIRIRHPDETEEREAVMQLASETDTESSSSSGSTPRVVSIVRKE